MSDDPRRNYTTVRAVAQAGNAVALFAILLILINSGHLFTTRVPPPPREAGTTRSARLLLVVVDGLRADSVTSDRMPQVHALAQRGTFRTCRVEALLPSTVAGLRALVEGVVVPPSEFVSDFRSRRAPGGGLIEAVHRSGGRVFTAGPHLWTDLYGPWITENLTVIGLARDDPSVLRTVHGAVRDPSFTLIVAQFCSPDVMAHMYGAASQEYARSVSWCDRAIGDLIQVAGKDTLIVITSDHGVTVAGGHAGAEPDVLETPLVASDKTFAKTISGGFSQAFVPHLLAEAMGRRLPSPGTVSVSPPFLSRTFVLLTIAATLTGGLAVIVLLRSSANARPPEYAAFGLNLSVWVCIVTAFLSPWVGCVLTFVLLVSFARHYWSHIPLSLVFTFIAGLIAGALRIATPWVTLDTRVTFHPSLLMIAAICLAAFGIGFGAARQFRSGSILHLTCIGAGLIAIAPLLSSILGENVSLSTLDVRMAFRFFETPIGLTATVFIAAVRPFLPGLFLIAGVTVYLWRRKEAETSIAALSTGAGALIAGELSIAAILLAGSSDQFLSALALGLLLRECALITVLFPVLAGAVFALRGAGTGYLKHRSSLGTIQRTHFRT